MYVDDLAGFRLLELIVSSRTKSIGDPNGESPRSPAPAMAYSSVERGASGGAAHGRCAKSKDQPSGRVEAPLAGGVLHYEALFSERPPPLAAAAFLPSSINCLTFCPPFLTDLFIECRSVPVARRFAVPFLPPFFADLLVRTRAMGLLRRFAAFYGPIAS